MDSVMPSAHLFNHSKANLIKRNWEMWGQDEKDDFFQALGDCGKDFDKILLFMKKQRQKVKCEEAKNKDQIRHLYYRTWNNIMKRLNLPPEKDPKRASLRECHYLICYGELRRKGITGFGSKAMKQLQDLVTTGCTVVRFRTRNIRLRAPIRAMKKLYPKLNPASDSTFPKNLTLEFLPHSMQSFNLVQAYAFNPRVRLSNISLHTKLSDIFEAFKKRYVDLSTSNLQLFLYPILPPNCSIQTFNSEILKAKQFTASFERKLDIPICFDTFPAALKQNYVMEDISTCNSNPTVKERDSNPEVKERDFDPEVKEKGDFPKIFGKKIPTCTDFEKKKDFPGYWDQSTCQGLFLNILYLVLGRKSTLKFKYEWKIHNLQTYKFGEDSLYWLVNMSRLELKLSTKCKERKFEKCVTEMRKTKFLSYQTGQLRKTITKKDNGFAIPLRPRPGRKKIINLNSQQSVPQNRYLVPRLSSSKDVVAVNLDLLPNSINRWHSQHKTRADFVNNRLPKINEAVSPVLVHEADSTCQVVSTKSLLQDCISNASLDNCIETVFEDIIEEGKAEEHYRSLNKLLESARQMKDEVLLAPHILDSCKLSRSKCSDVFELKKIMVDNDRFLTQNNDPPSQSLLVTMQSSCTSSSTPSMVLEENNRSNPNLDWLNGDAYSISPFDPDIALGNLKRFEMSNTISDNNLENKAIPNMSKTVDPTLPIFQTGESSQGVLDYLKFELSNPEKS